MEKSGVRQTHYRVRPVAYRLPCRIHVRMVYGAAFRSQSTPVGLEFVRELYHVYPVIYDMISRLLFSIWK